ncbi:MAG: hypothetical protein V1799_22120 [bacterium]
MNDQLLQQLRILKLPGFREHLQTRRLEANANKWILLLGGQSLCSEKVPFYD